MLIPQAIVTGSPGWTDWTNYTPQVDQGASTNITKTISVARYMVVGRMVFVEVALSMTGVGSAGNAVLITIPGLTPQFTDAVTQRGTGMYNDAGVLYRCTVAFNSTTNVGLFSTSVTANAFVGSNPSLAVASGDLIGFSIVYGIA